MQASSLKFMMVGFCALSACQTQLYTSGDAAITDPSAEKPRAPLSVTASRTPVSIPISLVSPVYDDIWDRIRTGFSLSREIDRKRVRIELEWFIKNPDYIERVTRRSSPHLYYIVNEIEKSGLPMEVALLPIVESAYDPFAYSRSRAAGLWQFIPSTARLYGLKIDWWQDGRRDVRASTRAAITYMTYLNELFNGDWLLSLAAYNSGQGNILSSIRKSKLPHDQIDFWSLKLLRETQAYVPRLLAISEIIANPESYKIELPKVPNQPHWSVVGIDNQLDLRKAADLAGINPQSLYFLNPGYNQWATHPDGPHEILLPIESVGLFKTSLDLLSPTERVVWHRHRIKSGENLSLIAQRHRTTVKTLKSVNNIKGNMIRAGDSLLIPAAAAGVEYNMTSRSRLDLRQKDLAQAYGSEPTIHMVKPGDSLWEISRNYDINMRKLAKWNGIGTKSTLYPGTELVIFQQSLPEMTRKITAFNAAKQPEHIRKLNYRVRYGESLSLIANKFNITVDNIKSWNEGLSHQKYIHPGDRLTLYVDVTSQVN